MAGAAIFSFWALEAGGWAALALIMTGPIFLISALCFFAASTAFLWVLGFAAAICGIAATVFSLNWELSLGIWPAFFYLYSALSILSGRQERRAKGVPRARSAPTSAIPPFGLLLLVLYCLVTFTLAVFGAREAWHWHETGKVALFAARFVLVLLVLFFCFRRMRKFVFACLAALSGVSLLGMLVQAPDFLAMPYIGMVLFNLLRGLVVAAIPLMFIQHIRTAPEIAAYFAAGKAAPGLWHRLSL